VAKTGTYIYIKRLTNKNVYEVIEMGREMEQDRQMLRKLAKEKLLDLFFLHIRNLWRVDGLYFLGIEKEFGTDAATRIDVECWKLMGRIEARNLREVLDVKQNDIASFMYLLRNTSWALDQGNKQIEATETTGVLRVTDCRTQGTRVRKGLGEFPCKQVRYGYLESFAKEFNPNIKLLCKVCPPMKHPKDIWCEWEFSV
jgi:hypothetical protein